jgi:hypothetical protein
MTYQEEQLRELMLKDAEVHKALHQRLDGTGSLPSGKERQKKKWLDSLEEVQPDAIQEDYERQGPGQI